MSQAGSAPAQKQEDGSVPILPRVKSSRELTTGLIAAYSSARHLHHSSAKVVRARVWRACEVCRKRKVRSLPPSLVAVWDLRRLCPRPTPTSQFFLPQSLEYSFLCVPQIKCDGQVPTPFISDAIPKLTRTSNTKEPCAYCLSSGKTCSCASIPGSVCP